MNYAIGFTSALCLLMMLATVPIAYREAKPRSSVAYGCGFLVLGIGTLLLLVPDAVLPRSLEFVTFTAAVALSAALFLVGTWLRCGVPIPYRWLALILLVWLVGMIPFSGTRTLMQIRTQLYGLCVTIGCVLAIWAIVCRKPRRNAADWMLVATFGFAGSVEVVLVLLPLIPGIEAGQIRNIRISTMPLALIGLGIFVLHSYALDSIDDLNRLSETDALTDLLNRRAFDQRLAKAIASAQRYQRPLSLVIADLDHFKRINDRFGHGSGDDVLQAFAALLRSESRSVDLVARFGGEEFAIIMPESDATAAAGYAERMRAATEQRIAVQQEVVTASFGVADSSDGNYDARALMTAADAALYAAKAAGRNRVQEYRAQRDAALLQARKAG